MRYWKKWRLQEKGEKHTTQNNSISQNNQTQKIPQWYFTRIGYETRWLYSTDPEHCTGGRHLKLSPSGDLLLAICGSSTTWDTRRQLAANPAITQIPLGSSRLDTTRHDSTRSTCRSHAFGCVELVEQHGSTHSTRRARQAWLAT